jgi:hypothetical protein
LESKSLTQKEADLQQRVCVEGGLSASVDTLALQELNPIKEWLPILFQGKWEMNGVESTDFQNRQLSSPPQSCVPLGQGHSLSEPHLANGRIVKK